MKPVLLLGPALGLGSCVARALAGDGDVVPPPARTPTLDYLLTLGPYGAFVWGAFLLGRGVRITVHLKLPESDREMIRGSVEGALRPGRA